MKEDPIVAVIQAIAIVAAVYIATAHGCEAGAEAPAPWTRDEVAIARLTVSEASFGGGADARVITWIVAHAAVRRELTPTEYIAQVHHRHTRSERRPWLAGLDETMREPAGWPSDVPWQRGALAWEQRLADVRRYLADDRHGCDGTPVTWGGTVDRERIARMVGNGYRVVRCGATANVFLGRVR